MNYRTITNKINLDNKTNTINKVVTPSHVSYLNLISLGGNSYTTAHLLTSLIATHNCNIIKSRIIELTPDLAMSAVISGKWNNIAKLEKSLVTFAKKQSIHIHTKCNSFPIKNLSTETPYLNYIVQTITIDKPGIINKLLHFFYQENLAIQEVAVNSNQNNIHLINIEIKVKILIDNHINSLREKFLIYCDNLNLDASLEPCD